MITDLINGSAVQGGASPSGGVLDKDAFLQILVTQLRHQDPLNPVKGEQLASQLAQFSSVEQLNNINANLESALELDFALNQSITNTMATTFVGKYVKALGNEVFLNEGEQVTLNYDLPAAASSVTIEIKDSAGKVVRNIELSSLLEGEHKFEWDGKDNDGNTLPEGTYEFNVSAEDVNGDSISAQTFVFGQINSIRYENGSAILLVNGLEIFMADVMEIGLAPELTEKNATKRTAVTR